MQNVRILPPTPTRRHEALRAEVRAFLAETLGDFPAVRRAQNWNGFDRPFGRALAARGWVGMTWPEQYGGHEKSAFERYVVWEELLAAGAPIVSVLPIDRQSGPLLLQYGSEDVKRRLLPAMARGELVFCVGMSEPNSGSDLASVVSTAKRTEAGWRLDGRKIWTSFAHKADYMVGLFRSRPRGERKHEGLSQFLIDLRSPGVTIRPIRNLQGQEHFNECTFDDVRLPPEALIGQEGDGWQQVTRELSFERSGPERFLSSHQLLVEMIGAASEHDSRHRVALGTLVAEMAALREMSLGVAGMLSRGEAPAIAAAMVKDRGTAFEQRIPQAAHDLFGAELGTARSTFDEVAAYTTQAAPQFSLRGGTREILRGVIARGLGLP